MRIGIMHSFTTVFLILLLVGLYLSTSIFVEGFIGSPDAKRCGVDQPPCKFGEACLNGWCNSATPPSLPTSTGLPVLPTPQQFNTAFIFN